MSEIYFDNSATTKVCRPAAQKVMELMTECYGNPSSLHTMGFRAERELAAARHTVAAALGAADEEVIFTSGGTEANNLAVFGAALARRRVGTHIVTTELEHPSVRRVMEELESMGFSVTYLEPDMQGHIAPEQVARAITPDTVLVSMMTVNNEVGTMLPLEAAAQAIAREKAPALLHTDAVQAFGKLPLKPSALRVDLMTVSSHKIHGPKGVGALYVKKGARILPRQFGGGQERGMRPGTEAAPLIAGFGAAVRDLPQSKEQYAYFTKINAILRAGLAKLPEVQINSPEDAVPYILNFSAGAVRAETMLHYLSAREIYLSSGSACAKGHASPVLAAMHLPASRVSSALRLSLCRENTEEEAAQFVSALAEGLCELKTSAG